MEKKRTCKYCNHLYFNNGGGAECDLPFTYHMLCLKIEERPFKNIVIKEKQEEKS